MSKIKELRIPDIGDFEAVEVIDVLVQVGAQVSVEDTLITLESDKASMDIPSSDSGIVKSVEVKVGDKVGKGDPMVTLELAESSTSESEQEQSGAPEPTAEEIETVQAPTPSTEPTQKDSRRPGEAEHKAPPLPMDDLVKTKTSHASPAVRRFARELGVDLSLVSGSGPKNRILKTDVQQFVKSSLGKTGQLGGESGTVGLPTSPSVDYSQFGSVETQPLGRIKKISGAHLHRCWLTVPHVTQFDEADITELEAFRKSNKTEAQTQGLKLTFMPFLVKAVAAALSHLPIFNAAISADGESLIYRKFIHIGVAVDTPNGLMVPVIRDVDQKGVFELAADLMSVGDRARQGKLSPRDLQGGCFTISSLGGIGGTGFTPIVNSPEVAILGVSRAMMKPVWNGEAFEPRLMLPLSLSYDHRVIDGADGVRFTTYLSGLVSDIRKLLL